MEHNEPNDGSLIIDSMEKMISGNFEDIPEDARHEFEKAQGQGITPVEMRLLALIYATFTDATAHAKDPSARLGIPADILASFAEHVATETPEVMKMIDPSVDHAMYGTMMFLVGALFGVEWQERRHA